MPGAPVRSLLLVEDELLIAMDLEDVLRERGVADLTLAADYEQAAAALDARAFDLVVFDLDLEGVSSLPLVEARHAAGGASIVTSGYESPPRALAALGVPVLGKPVHVGDLREAAATLDLQLG